MKYWALLAAVYFFAGCIPTEVWKVDSRFTPEERAVIDQAAEAWTNVGANIILAHGHRVNGMEASGRYIVRGTERTADQIAAWYGSPPLSPDALGKHVTYTGKEAIIIVADRHRRTPLSHVVTHEFGHSLGIDHVDDERAIMYHAGSDKSLHCVTSVDIMAFCGVNDCAQIPKGCDE